MHIFNIRREKNSFIQDKIQEIKENILSFQNIKCPLIFYVFVRIDVLVVVTVVRKVNMMAKSRYSFEYKIYQN